MAKLLAVIAMVTVASTSAVSEVSTSSFHSGYKDDFANIVSVGNAIVGTAVHHCTKTYPPRFCNTLESTWKDEVLAHKSAIEQDTQLMKLIQEALQAIRGRYASHPSDDDVAKEVSKWVEKVSKLRSVDLMHKLKTAIRVHVERFFKQWQTITETPTTEPKGASSAPTASGGASSSSAPSKASPQTSGGPRPVTLPNSKHLMVLGTALVDTAVARCAQSQSEAVCSLKTEWEHMKKNYASIKKDKALNDMLLAAFLTMKTLYESSSSEADIARGVQQWHLNIKALTEGEQTPTRRVVQNFFDQWKYMTGKTIPKLLLDTSKHSSIRKAKRGSGILESDAMQR